MRETRELERGRGQVRSFVVVGCGLVALVAYACGGGDGGGGPGATTGDAGVVDGSLDGTSGDGGEGAPVIYASGTRLRARVFRAGDVERLDTFVDTARGSEACNFVAIDERTARCLPQTLRASYSDATCATPVVEVPPCGEGVALAGIYGQESGCGGLATSSVELREIGASVTVSELFEKSLDGRCVSRGAPSVPVRAVGAAVPLTSFAAATLVRVNASSSIALDTWVGEDGSARAVELVDRARGVACGPQRLGPRAADELRCVPASPALSDNIRGPYADSACSIPAAYTFRPASCRPTTALRLEVVLPIPACPPPSTYSLFAVGEPLATYYGGSPSACAPSNLGNGAFRLGAPIAPSELPALSQVTRGTGPVRARVTTSDGVALENPGLEDASGSPCGIERFEDGKQYCVPQTTIRGGARAFRDAACTQPVQLRVDACSPPHTRAIVEVSSNCTGSTYRTTVSTLGPPVAAPEIWQDTGSGCTGPTPNTTEVYPVTGTATAAEAFPEIVTELR